MGFFDFNWFGKRERVYNLDQVYNDMRSLIDPENTLHDLHTIRGIHTAFKKADILQSIEITCRDYSKNCKVFTKKDQKEVIINQNLKGQTFTDVYSEIIREKTKYSVSVVRKVQGAFSGKATIECLRLHECIIDFGTVQYPTINDLRYVEYHNEKIYPQDLLIFGNANALVYCEYNKEGIEYAVSNLINDYEAKHNIIADRGAMIILSPNPGKQDQMSFGSSLKPNEKEEVERALTKKYGVIGKKKTWKFFPIPMNVTNTSMNVAELGISEDKKENITAICSHLKYPPDLYFNATTYENQAVARASVYNNILIPFASEDSITLSKWLGYDVEIDYSHVSDLQENEKTKVERNNQVVNYCSSAVSAGIMSIEEARKELNNYIDLENGTKKN